MAYDCSHCSETFRTLSRKRLHDCPQKPATGPEEWEDHDVQGEDMDAIAEKVASELLTCVHCGREIEEEIVGELEQIQTPDSLGLIAEFDCPHCGGHQRNEAELA